VNRAARRHLLAKLERDSSPLYFATYDSPGGPVEDFLRALEGTRGRSATVMPPGVRFDVVRSRREDAPRVVAGKGARRRGVHGRVPPLRFWTRPSTRGGA
jgi:hypothetical protein